jgi:hypothetical protein
VNAGIFFRGPFLESSFNEIVFFKKDEQLVNQHIIAELYEYFTKYFF